MVDEVEGEKIKKSDSPKTQLYLKNTFMNQSIEQIVKHFNMVNVWWPIHAHSLLINFRTLSICTHKSEDMLKRW